MLSEISYDEFQELAKYAISRLDGAWFRAAASKFGITEAVDLDVQVWGDWMERMGRRIKKTLKIKRIDPQAILNVLSQITGVLSLLMGGKREVTMMDDKIFYRISQCEYWENIKKAGFTKFAEAGLLCSRVHTAGLEGLLKGAFPNLKFEFNHTKRIPSGDPYCETISKLFVRCTHKKSSNP